jgi:hypothetical protein
MAKLPPDFDPSKPLADARREAFARDVADAVAVPEAYRKAGWKPDRGNAWRMSRAPDVAARIAYLSGQKTNRSLVAVVEAEKPKPRPIGPRPKRRRRSSISRTGRKCSATS